jgi:hypothetical protein
VDKFLGRDWLVAMESIVCCATLSLSQEEGYAIVDDTSAKMEGRNRRKLGYDALVEVYCVLLLERRATLMSCVLSEQDLFMYHEIAVGSFPSIERLKTEFNS